MFNISRRKHWLAITAIAGCVLAPLTWRNVGAEGKPGQLIATVDLLKVYSPEWKTFAAANSSIKDKQDKYKQIIQEFVPDQSADAAVPPVDTTVLSQWIGLKDKIVMHPDAVKDDDRKTLADYENQGKRAIERLVLLENKGNAMTDGDKNELDKLHQLRAQAQQALNTQAQQYADQLQGQFADAQKQMEGQVQDAINKVGSEQGVTYILNASVVSQLGGTQKIVLFSSDKNLDITEQVLKKLNK